MEAKHAYGILSYMPDTKTDLENLLKGKVDDSQDVRQAYSHDASLFELVPELVVSPKDAGDIKKLVSYVARNKKTNPGLSITARSGGTCMSGGSIGQSIVVDFTKHLNKLISVSSEEAHVEPGMYYRDFEPETLKKGVLMPSYPASRDLCTVGGMVANNSGGEMSLVYGKTLNFVNQLSVVLADGNSYSFGPLTKKELDQKMKQKDFEGDIYRKTFALVDNHYSAIKAAKPHVSKNSTGYNLWDVWDRETGIFDLSKALVGSQGTLGLVTDINFRLVKADKHSGTLVIFLRDISQLGDIINVVLSHRPSTFEGFDNYTLLLSFKLFFYFRRTLGWLGMLKLGLQLIPSALLLFRGIPKMVLLVEFKGDDTQEIKRKVHQMRVDLKPFDSKELYEEDNTEFKAKKFWIMRRESFNLLRKKVKNKHTAPFIDDLVVPPARLPAFLPKLRKIINKYKLLATIAGHMGDGNFHVIPLMEIEKPQERAKLEPAMREVNELVLKYGGSLSGEHNDGMIRGPWLEQMYGEKVVGYFTELKYIFDPDNIFNPHKKTDADWDFSMSHIRDSF